MYSHKKITLNSLKVIDELINLYSGISLYKEKLKIQSSLVIGGKIPENKSHLVIDRPESVSLVKPPTTIIIATKTVIVSIQ